MDKAVSIPVPVLALAAMVCERANALPPRYSIAVALREGGRFLIRSSGAVYAGWSDETHLRLITTSRSLRAFLEGRLDASEPGALFVWTGDQENMDALSAIFAPPQSVL